MDNYCRTCMRDSNKFSPIFEEMTYGGISLQEAIEDVFQLEILIGDDLPLYVCRDCALKIYDIVKFKMEAHEVYSSMRKLMAIHPRIKVENDETIEEASPYYPETENIKVEDVCVSHFNEDSYNANPDTYENATNADAWDFEPSQSSVKVESSIRRTYSFEDEMPRLILEDSDIEEEIGERVNITPGDMENKFAAVFRDTPELPSIFLVNSESLNDPEVTYNENVDAISYLSETTAASVVLDTSGKTGVESYICQVCGKTAYHRKRHELIHPEEKLFACKYCTKMFQTAYHRNRHELIHTGEKPFACKYCSKMFQTAYHRNRHELIHPTEKLFACKYCSKMFQTAYHRNRHELIHPAEKLFACKYCSKTFQTAYNRNRHELIHTGEKPFACKYCSKMFQTAYHRNRHELIHPAEKLFACKYCSKMFQTAYHRNRHELIHPAEKLFACKYCSKMFQTAYHRNRHELIHPAEKPFACKYCAMCFRTVFDRKRHEMIHSGEKPFACKFCSKTFTRKSHLTRHELIHTRVAQN